MSTPVLLYGKNGKYGVDGISKVIKFETILFYEVSEYTLDWNAERKAKFGASCKPYVEILDENGVARHVMVEAVADDINNTTSYHFDFGDVSTGRITI